MNDGKRNSQDPAGKQPVEADNDSEGQYGGLKGLGPGGGSDLEEALDTDDIDPDEDETSRK